MQVIDESVWSRYRSLFPAGFRRSDLPLPGNLEYFGALQCTAHPVPPAALLEALAAWLADRGEDEVYMFLTEIDRTITEKDYALGRAELTPTSFKGLQGYFYAKVLTAKDFSWALFVDADGVVHVAGEKSLYEAIASVTPQEQA